MRVVQRGDEEVRPGEWLNLFLWRGVCKAFEDFGPIGRGGGWAQFRFEGPEAEAAARAVGEAARAAEEAARALGGNLAAALRVGLPFYQESANATRWWSAGQHQPSRRRDTNRELFGL